jgi:hypothetical protein
MDNQKDIQKTDGIIKFVEYHSLKTNPFGENRVGERAYRRAERLASAIVLLTNHVSDKEQLKHSARSSAIELLSSVMSLRDEMRASNSEKGRELKSMCRELISIIRLLAVAGFVSFQNAEAVTEALDELSSFLAASRRSMLSETVSITRDELLDVREITRGADIRLTDKPFKDKDSLKDTQSSSGISVQRGNDASHTSSRSQAILEVLKVNGELGIRDVASNLPEYSEKMIQRELVELVAAGRVKKMGLKRWSRYAFVA